MRHNQDCLMVVHVYRKQRHHPPPTDWTESSHDKLTLVSHDRTEAEAGLKELTRPAGACFLCVFLCVLRVAYVSTHLLWNSWKTFAAGKQPFRQRMILCELC